MLGEVLADDAEFERTVLGSKIVGNPHEVRIAGVGMRGGHLSHPDPVAPFDFERRRREIKWPGKSPFAANAGFGDRLFGGEQGDALGQLRGRH